MLRAGTKILSTAAKAMTRLSLRPALSTLRASRFVPTTPGQLNAPEMLSIQNELLSKNQVSSWGLHKTDFHKNEMHIGNSSQNEIAGEYIVTRPADTYYAQSDFLNKNLGNSKLTLFRVTKDTTGYTGFQQDGDKSVPLHVVPHESLDATDFVGNYLTRKSQ